MEVTCAHEAHGAMSMSGSTCYAAARFVVAVEEIEGKRSSARRRPFPDIRANATILMGTDCGEPRSSHTRALRSPGIRSDGAGSEELSSVWKHLARLARKPRLERSLEVIEARPANRTPKRPAGNGDAKAQEPYR